MSDNGDLPAPPDVQRLKALRAKGLADLEKRHEKEVVDMVEAINKEILERVENQELVFVVKVASSNGTKVWSNDRSYIFSDHHSQKGEADDRVLKHFQNAYKDKGATVEWVMLAQPNRGGSGYGYKFDFSHSL